MSKHVIPALLFCVLYAEISDGRVQSSSKKCQAFKWGGGGSSGSSSGLHWYSCCNNCNDTDPYCDGTTYQSASSGKYCGHCGLDIAPRKPETFKSEFYCGLCNGQERVRRKCHSNFREIYDIPGLCWAFTQCFRDFCTDWYSLKRSTAEMPGTCYNFRCDQGETVENCPVDCCATINPDTCAWKNGTCAPQCCAESTCCKTSAANQQNEVTRLLIIVTVLLASTLVKCIGV